MKFIGKLKLLRAWGALVWTTLIASIAMVAVTLIIAIIMAIVCGFLTWALGPELFVWSSYGLLLGAPVFLLVKTIREDKRRERSRE